MLLESIERITDKEKDAAALRVDYAAQAARLVEAARTEGQEHLRRVEMDGFKTAIGLTKAAEARAEAVSHTINAESEKHCDDLRRTAQSRREEAILAIVERVVNDIAGN
jgi:vacuolar-type H+-ATPase subunit H